MKKIRYLILTMVSLFIFSNVKAEYSASINASSTSVTVGQNVTVTIYANNLMGVYSVWSSNYGILSGSVSGDPSIDSPSPFSKTVVFTAVSPGCASINFAPDSSAGLTDYDLLTKVQFTRSVEICVQERYTPQPIYINRTYSDNNNLSGLSIDGYELTPGFDKDTLEYTIELIPGTERINVNTSLESDVASVRGNGEVEVTDGMNTITITVIAENGNEKTYVIKAHMEEKDPIIIKMDNQEYTVIKKREYIKPIDGYKEGTVKINGFDIPTLYNEITGYTLVGLKDKDGYIKMYLYDSKNGEYKDYIELAFNKISLFILEDEDSEYEKVSIRIGEDEVTAYKYSGSSEYYLLYGTNTTTGNTGYYLYDTKENTVQRYTRDTLDKLSEEKDKYFTLIIVLGSICFITMLFLLLVASKIKNED